MYVIKLIIQINNGDCMSVFNINEKNRNIKELNNDISVDILIIGGGMTGLTSAYFLKSNKDICVVDTNLIGHGVTMNSTAKINYFQQCIYTNITKATNYNNAVKYLKSQKEAIKCLKNIIEKEKIDCNFKKISSYVFANSVDEVDILDSEIKFLKRNNIDVKEGNLPNNIDCYKSYYVNDTYIFNPIKYLNGLYKILIDNNINIYENTKIVKIEKVNNKYICYGTNYKITANKVILAMHYPFFIIPFMMPLRCSIEKSYIVVSKAEKDLNYTCISTNNPVYSCRYYEDKNNIYQISLSKSHDISANNNDAYYFKRVKDIFNIKKENVVMEYTNSDIMTPDNMPYIGKLREDLYIGVGYNTWGMTNSVLAAKIITDSILNKENEYKDIFNPKRVSIKSLTKLPIYIINNAKSFIGTKLVKNKNWYSGNVYFYKENGKNLACYKDKDGHNHIIHNKCPHLGCSLIFNEVEKTWDCPCHSSRFDMDGKCIKGPSAYDITYKR